MNTLENKAKFFDEIWIDVKGYEYYQISNYGRLRRWSRCNKKYCYKKASNDKAGYKRYKLTENYISKNYMAHRLVISNFKHESNLEVNHIDGIKDNNHINNLEYCTRSQNIKHAIKNNLKIGINKRDEKGRIKKGNQS